MKDDCGTDCQEALRDLQRFLDGELPAETRSEALPRVRGSTRIAPGERVDPNEADELQLDRLPRVGPALAQRIVEFREANGRFRTLAESYTLFVNTKAEAEAKLRGPMAEQLP